MPENRVKSTIPSSSDRPSAYLNLRKIEQQRFEALVRRTRGVVNLRVRGAEQERREAAQAEADQERLVRQAKWLLDLRRSSGTIPSGAKLVGPLETEIVSRPAQIFPTAGRDAPPSGAADVAPAGATEEQSSQLPDDVETIFPEYFEAIPKTKQPAPFAATVEKQTLEFTPPGPFHLDFLTPALELGQDRTRSRGAMGARLGFWQFQKRLLSQARSGKRFRTRSLLWFAVLVLFLVGSVGASAAVQRTLDSQGKILTKATAAAGSLKSAAANLKEQKFLQAVSDFERSAQFFKEAQKDIDGIGDLTTRLLTFIPRGRAALSLVEAGQAMAEAGGEFTEGLSHFRQIGSLFGATDAGRLTLGEAIEQSRGNFETVARDLDTASAKLDQVSADSLPANFRSDFTEASEILIVLKSATNYFLNSAGQLAKILGSDGPRRYLVLLANGDEMRGSAGGFPGSYLIVDCDGGRIKNLSFHDIYEVRGQTTAQVVPPRPLQLITDNFEIQDAAGWFLDYRTTAQKVMEYYQLSEVGTTVDGVFTVNASIIPDLIKITGPINLPQFNVIIDANNYLTEIEKEVESDEARATAEPKKIVESFFNNLFAKVLSQREMEGLSLLGVLNAALAEKKIQLYFSDPELEDFAYQNNAAGELKDANNYLAVYAYNIGGGKTDSDIRGKVNQISSLAESGELKNVVEITRELQPQDTLSSVKNVSWMRVVLPAEATVKEVSGFDPSYPVLHQPDASARPDQAVQDMENSAERLYDGQVWVTAEEGKKVVGFWLGVEPGQKRTVRVTYDLPRVASLSGLLDEAAGLTTVFQVQPGISQFHVSGQIFFPSTLDLAWEEGQNAFLQPDKNSLSWSADNPEGDVVVSSVWVKK